MLDYSKYSLLFTSLTVEVYDNKIKIKTFFNTV